MARNRFTNNGYVNAGRSFGRPAVLLAARGLFFLACVAIVVLSLVPGQARPHTGYPGGAEHFAAYAGAGFFLAFAWIAPRDRILGLLGLAAASGCLEALQEFSPGRHPSLADALASSSGAVFGAAAGALSFAIVVDKLAL
jgi:VanZ family protein